MVSLVRVGLENERRLEAEEGMSSKKTWWLKIARWTNNITTFLVIMAVW